MTAPALSKLPALIASGAIRAYQLAVSPYMAPCCRFYPTCSEYGREALQTHGFFRGLGLTLWRILRCNPWGKGGYDPVPPCRHPSHHGHDHGITPATARADTK